RRNPTAAAKYRSGTGHGLGTPRTLTQKTQANTYHSNMLTVEKAMDAGLYPPPAKVTSAPSVAACVIHSCRRITLQNRFHRSKVQSRLPAASTAPTPSSAKKPPTGSAVSSATAAPATPALYTPMASQATGRLT